MHELWGGTTNEEQRAGSTDKSEGSIVVAEGSVQGAGSALLAEPTGPAGSVNKGSAWPVDPEGDLGMAG